MSIFDNVLARFGYSKAATAGQQAAYPMAMAQEFAYEWPNQPRMLRQASLYEKSSWIYTAISFVARAAAAVDFEIYERVGDSKEEIEDHPFEKLLRKPNPLQSRFELLEATFSYLKLGDAYWWLNCPAGTSDAMGEPVEIWVIPPQSIRPVPDGNLFLKCYEYAYSGGVLELPPCEVVHFKTFNPLNPFLGLSQLNPIEMQANSDIATVAKDYRANGMHNGRLPGILAFGDDFQPTEWETMKAQIDDRSQKMRQYMLLHGVKDGGVSWINTAMSNREMQSLEIRNLTRDEIFGVLAPGLASTLVTNATEANAKAGKGTLADYALYPMLESVAQKITNDVLPCYGENLVGEFEEIRMKDQVIEMEEIRLYSQTHTLEEIRNKYYGDGPLGDERDKLLPAQITAGGGSSVASMRFGPEGSAGQGANPAIVDGQPDGTGQQAGQPMMVEGESSVGMQADPLQSAEAAAEIKRWRKVARKCVAAGRPMKEFESEVIPEPVREAIRAGLAEAKTDEAVMAVFAGYRTKQDEQVDDLAEELRLAREWLEAHG